MPKQSAPFIDADGQRYLNVRQAAQIVRGVCKKTLWNWASHGVTSFGFHLDVKRVRLAHHARAFRHDARTHRETRMLIPENQIKALAEIMQAAGKTKPGPLSRSEMVALKAAMKRHSIGSGLHHG
jgi:hypothetical protein